MPDIRAALRERVLVCDGAIGTMLHDAGHPFDGSVAMLNLSHPSLVATVHDSYIDAGCDIVQTNTFGANRLRLSLHGQASSVREVNLAGVRIARECRDAAGRELFVAGSVSPAVMDGQRLLIHPQERVTALREQIEILVEGGIDLVILETFGFVDELTEAIDVAADYGLPIVAQVTFTEDGLTVGGQTPEVVAISLASEAVDVDVIGINCSLGPRQVLKIINTLSEHTDLPLSVQPDAGRPLRSDSDHQLRFDLDVEYFASFAPRYVEAGCVLLGGCCGTTPAMMQALANHARGLKPARLAGKRSRSSRVPASPSLRMTVESFDRKLESDRFLVGVELTTPRSSELPAALATASQLHQQGVDYFRVSLTKGREGRIGPLSFAAAIRERTGAELVHSMSTQGRSLIGLQAGMLGAFALNVHNIVCEDTELLIGGRDYPLRDNFWETDSLGQVLLLADLNEGKDCHGGVLGTSTSFHIGARCDLGRDDLEAEAGRVAKLLEAGARFLLVGPIYECETLRRFQDALSVPMPPTLVTIKPLRDLDDAEQLYHEARGLHVPRSALEAMAAGGANDHKRGVALAEELLLEVRSLSSGVLLSVEDEVSLQTLLGTAVGS